MSRAAHNRPANYFQLALSCTPAHNFLAPFSARLGRRTNPPEEKLAGSKIIVRAPTIVCNFLLVKTSSLCNCPESTVEDVDVEQKGNKIKAEWLNKF